MYFLIINNNICLEIQLLFFVLYFFIINIIMRKTSIFVISLIIGIGTSVAQKISGELVVGVNMSVMPYFT